MAPSITNLPDAVIFSQGVRAIGCAAIPTITCLAVGILGIHEQVSMPKETAYFMTGLGTALAATIGSAVASYFWLTAPKSPNAGPNS